MNPQEIVMSATARCNLKCIMCDIPRSGKKDKFTLIEYKKLIDDIVKAGVTEFVFSGGEPLLVDDFFEILSYASSKGLNVSVPTNGILIDQEIAGKLKKAGVKVVNVSVEGPNDIHNIIRGKGSFEKAINALKCLRKAGVETTIAMTVMSINYKYMHYVINLAIDLGATTVKFQPFSEDFLINKKQKTKFIIKKDELPSLKAEIERVIDFANYCGVNINPATYLRAMPGYFAGTLKVSHCSAPQRSCAIDNLGNVYACWTFKEPIGNLFKENFMSIWNSKKFEEIRQLAAEGKCPGCLMSCYDKIFEPTKQKNVMVKKMGGLKTMLLNKLKRMRTKILKTDYKQHKKDAEAPPISPSEIQEALDEIEEAKKILLRKLKNA